MQALRWPVTSTLAPHSQVRAAGLVALADSAADPSITPHLVMFPLALCRSRPLHAHGALQVFLLQHQSWRVREGALRVITRMGPACAPNARAALLADPISQVRIAKTLC